MSRFFITLFIAFAAFLTLGLADAVKAEALPDLVIDSVTFDPVLFYPIITVKNQGSAPTPIGQSIVTKYIWINANGVTTTDYRGIAGNHYYDDAGTGLLPSQSVRVGPGPNILVTRQEINEAMVVRGIGLPRDGDVKVHIWVDREGGYIGQIRESNEDNNETEVTLPMADLVVSSVDFSWGSRKIIIKNQGNATVPEYTEFEIARYFLRADDSIITQTPTEYIKVKKEIGPGQSIEIIPYATLPADAAKVVTIVNSGMHFAVYGRHAILESNLNNNKKITDWSPIALTDLRIEITGFDPDAGYPIVYVYNRGNGLLPSGLSIDIKATWLRDDDSIISSVSLPFEGDISAQVGEIQQLNILSGYSMDAWLPPVDAVKVKITVDSTKKLLEWNEDDNEDAFYLPGRAPRFVVESARTFFGAWGATPRILVKNVGDTPRLGDFSVRLEWLNDYDFFGFGSSPKVTFRGNLLPGQITILSDWQPEYAIESQPYDATRAKFVIILSEEYDGGTYDGGIFNLPLPTSDTPLDDLVYPVQELGNCQNKEDCQAYCEIEENAGVCADFGRRTGLMTEEEAETAEEIDEISEDNPGPGNCTTKESCEEFCEVPANIEACLNYAEQNNWMSAEDLSKARKVAGVLQSGGVTPGSCNTPSSCKAYCSDNTHAVECVAFGKTAGLLTAEEAAEAEKVAPLMQSGQMPGGGKNREEIEAYCDKKENREECDKFFEQVGVKKEGEKSEGEEPQENAPSIFEGREGGGPGGCKTKAECDAYCDAHPGECDEAVIEAGGEVKEAAVACSTREECESFCNDPANKEVEACKSGTIIIEKEPPESAGPTEGPGEDPLEKLRSDIQEVISQSQSQDCVKQILGEEVFTKFVIEGGIPEKAISREALQPCFEEAKRVIEQQEMLKMQKKPDDPDMGNPPPSGKISAFLASVINILKWFIK